MCAATLAFLSSAGGLLTVSYFAYINHQHYIKYKTMSQKFIAVVVEQDKKNKQPEIEQTEIEQTESKKTSKGIKGIILPQQKQQKLKPV